MIEIRRLTSDGAQDLCALLQLASSRDRTYFWPFNFEICEIQWQLDKCVRDMFFGIYAEGKRFTLVGFYMLRGVDEGFESPMYGVFIGPDFRRKGLARLSISHAVSVCTLCRYPSVLLKVHKRYTAGIQLYRSCGFQLVGDANELLVMEHVIPTSRERPLSVGRIQDAH